MAGAANRHYPNTASRCNDTVMSQMITGVTVTIQGGHWSGKIPIFSLKNCLTCGHPGTTNQNVIYFIRPIITFKSPSLSNSTVNSM